jgi:hypothetical protein
MKKSNFIAGFCIVFIGFLFITCDISTGGGSSPLANLQAYQNVGASVAAKTWNNSYDCSNFSTQFYQNCYKAGLPCRVRLGVSGGDNFDSGDHAWNSVKIDGEWVNWEPQINDIYNGHRQTRTPLGSGWGSFVVEDIARIIYETVGKYVPKSVIDSYEIDTHWSNNSSFLQYFVPISFCLSDDQDSQDLVLYLQTQLPNNNSGAIFTEDGQHLQLFFKYNNKYYAIENIDERDPLEGRSAVKQNTLKDSINLNKEFIRLDVDIFYK